MWFCLSVMRLILLLENVFLDSDGLQMLTVIEKGVSLYRWFTNVDEFVRLYSYLYSTWFTMSPCPTVIFNALITLVLWSFPQR